MAGGWNKRGARIPLAERVRMDGAAAPGSGPVTGPESGPGAGPAGAPVPVEPGCPSRHCWVDDPVDGLGDRRPGLLVEWRRQGDSWEGRVVYAAALRAGDAAVEWGLVEEWLPAERLTPR